ncbi:DUF4974 domain-containing protein [Chitinophaga sp. Cy-1792]|nr:DUF4974 domain-containing protein [Chitinophaga sp. Cy-1792]
MMNNEKMNGILLRIIENTATDEDLAAYAAWCDHMQHRQLQPENLDELESAILQNIHSAAGITKSTRVFRWKAMAAAAMVAGLITGGVYIYHHLSQQNQTKNQSLVNNLPTDLPAGKNKATLILANGKKIALADCANGKISEEAGSDVNKTAAGSLEYHATNGDNNAAPQFNTLQTARGEQYVLGLPDGTRVWVNASSTLTFPTSFKGLKNRSVTITGEAYFEVAPNAAQPFLVHNGTQEIAVLGTSFNVNNYPDEPASKITLLQGAVKINDKVLKPGQQAVTGQDGVLKINTVETSSVIAWKNGYFEFNDENIFEIMRKVSRWYDVDVVYNGEIPMNKMEGSISRQDSVSRLLNTIQRAGLLRFSIEQKKIVVSKY